MKQDTLIKINKVIRIMICIALIVLAVFAIKFKFGPCDVCGFDVPEFMTNYSSKCLMQDSPLKPLEAFNFTGVFG